jgi:F-type H+-transporting ATPase subunit alpha
MQIRPEEITQILKTQLKDFDKKLDISETGSVISVGDGVAKIYGLEKAMAGELVDFGSGVFGMILNLEEEAVGVAILGDDTIIKEGSP